MSLLRPQFLLLSLLLPLAACNSGLGTIFSSSSDTPADSPSTISGFSITASKVSPAPIRFRMIDGNGGTVMVTLFFQLPGGDPIAMTQLGGADNPAAYDASPEGIEHTILWDFSAEPDLPADGSFVDGVTVWAEVPGNMSVIEGSNATLGGLGNDAPAVAMLDVPSGEGSGVIPIGFEVADSSTDLISMKVEYRLEGETTWFPARPGGEDATPEYAFVGLSAPPEGVSGNFFWDTDFDLPSQERDVRLRFTPTDGVDESAPFESDVFRVDNNEEALALLDNGLVTLNSDRSGGIAIPFTLRDDEGDDIRVVLQWRRPGGEFPELPASQEEIFAATKDPALRATYQICTEQVSYYSGRPVPGDSDTTLRLPEMGTSKVPLASVQLLGRELEIVRPANRLVEVSADWSKSSITNLVAAASVGDGQEAIVLDESAAGSWSLRRIDVTTGALVEDIASGGGTPTALSVDRFEGFAFVAATEGSEWQVSRIELATGDVVGPATGTFSEMPGVRGLAACTTFEVLLTVDDSIRRVDFAKSPGLVSDVLSGLDTPWGVVCDPQARDTVLVAENGADRVLSVNTQTHEWSEVQPADPSLAPTTVQQRFTSPRAVALEARGSRLLVTTEAEGERQLVAFNRNSTHDLDASGFADAQVFVLQTLPAGAGDAVAVGADSLRLLPAGAALHAMGGLEQRRTIVDSPVSGNLVTLDSALAPALDGHDTGKSWRVRRVAPTFTSSPEGVQHTYAWDSRDVPRGGSVLFQVLPFDSEIGSGSSTTLERDISSTVGAVRVPINDNAPNRHVLPQVVDFDRDGDLDVVISAGPNSQLFRQIGKGSFDPVGEALPLDLSTSMDVEIPSFNPETVPSDFYGPQLLFRDLDGDGHLDIAHFTGTSDMDGIHDLAVEIVRGTGPETFEGSSSVLTVPGDTAPFRRLSLHCADTNGDGDLDLIVHGSGVPFPVPPPKDPKEPTPEPDPVIDLIGIYEQTSPGVFATMPVNVAVEGTTDRLNDIEPVDVDGDGRIDLVVCIEGAGGLAGDNGRIVVLYQSESGTFDEADIGDVSEQVKGVIDPAANAKFAVAADMDGDGDRDIVVAHGNISSLFQNVAVPAYAGMVTIHWQTAPRIFDPEPLMLLPPGTSGFASGNAALEVADMDADGRQDIVVQDRFAVNIFFSKGAGEFGTRFLDLRFDEAGDTGDILPLSNALPVADLDGDGYLDVVVHDLRTTDVIALMNFGTGMRGFAETPELFLRSGTNDSTSGANDSVVSDFDSDGDWDFAITTGGIGFGAENDVKMFFQSSPRTFISTPLQIAPAGGPLLVQFPQRIDAADMDGDGDRDLAITSNGTNQVIVFLQDESVQFQEVIIFDGVETMDPPNAFWNSPTDLAISDADFDGDLDLLIHPNRFLRFRMYEQTSPGIFDIGFEIGKPSVEVEFFGTASTVVDLDGDGDVEIYGCSTNVGSLILDGVGPLDFSTTETTITETGTRSPLVIDADQDGDLDIMSLSVNGNNGATGIILSRQNEAGTFDEFMLPVSGTSNVLGGFGPAGRSIQMADIDDDGDLDLVALNGGAFNAPGTLTVLEQLAPGVFAAEPSYTYPVDVAGGHTVYLEDIDGDGELDAIMTLTGFGEGEVNILWGGL